MHELDVKDVVRLGCAVLCVACCFLAGSVAASPVYTVKQGDTLLGIAKAHKMSYERLCSLNNKPYDWCLIKVGQKIIVSPMLPRLSEERLASLGTPYAAEPKEAKLLNEYGDLALFSGETEADVAFNTEATQNGNWSRRNSLFLLKRTKEGPNTWRLLLTSGGDWKDTDGMGEWDKNMANEIRKCFNIIRASLSRDGRYVWMVYNLYIPLYDVVCRFDLSENTLCVLTDGDSADEEPDGTIWVLNKKIYLYDKNGEPDGAAWIEEWITPDGEVVRKGEPKRAADVLDYDTAVKLHRKGQL